MIKTKINKKKKVTNISNCNEITRSKLFFVGTQLMSNGYNEGGNLVLTERLKVKVF